MDFKLVLAPDSFKDSISAEMICHILEEMILKKYPYLKVDAIPLSDGGEGFVTSLKESLNLNIVEKSVTGPLGNKINAKYGITNNTAYIEMAQSSGLQYLTDDERNPLNTTTYGLGELIKDAIDRGVKTFVLGIGGSATCEGGAGMAQALGARFFDQHGKLLAQPITNRILSKCTTVDISELKNNIAGCEFKVACDVTNPLLGKNGAVYIYGPQKGAGVEELPILEANIAKLHKIFISELGKNVAEISGAGAAGGLGAGLIAFLNARLKSGSKYILNILEFEKRIQTANAIITGEGKIDNQTINGKIISEIINKAEKIGCPVYAICGINELFEQNYLKEIVSLVSFADRKSAINEPEEYIKLAGQKLIDKILEDQL